uniref:OSJNBa0083D01.6 protein n=1 Tax=Oryza sativa subsp. japonica TaxID=39947 RepID=Q7XVF2_ORYSJ|nr:OSJNBa0083D01.6 [Oryza sativa Japonica Group]
MTITELVVERYAPSGHRTESRHRIGKDLIKIRETQGTLSLLLKL